MLTPDPVSNIRLTVALEADDISGKYAVHKNGLGRNARILQIVFGPLRGIEVSCGRAQSESLPPAGSIRGQVASGISGAGLPARHSECNQSYHQPS